MKKLLFIPFCILIYCAWFTPRPSSQFVSSTDVLAVSSDSASVGVADNFWRNAFFRNQNLAYRAEAPSTNASFGTVWASTDGHLYYTNSSGVSTQLDN